LSIGADDAKTRFGQRENAGYVNAGVDVSEGVGVGAVVSVGANGQGVSLGVGVPVGLVQAPPSLNSIASSMSAESSSLSSLCVSSCRRA